MKIDNLNKVITFCAIFLTSATVSFAQAMGLVAPTAEEIAQERLIDQDREIGKVPPDDDDDDRQDDDGPPDDGDSCRYIDCGEDDFPLPEDTDSIPLHGAGNEF